jgi:hypothetical protein
MFVGWKMSKVNIKITAIHGGGDWYDASADYLILPEDMSYDVEKASRQKWYETEYNPAMWRGEKPEYISMVDWLKQRGAVEPTEDQLTIVYDG